MARAVVDPAIRVSRTRVCRTRDTARQRFFMSFISSGTEDAVALDGRGGEMAWAWKERGRVRGIEG